MEDSREDAAAAAAAAVALGDLDLVTSVCSFLMSLVVALDSLEVAPPPVEAPEAAVEVEVGVVEVKLLDAAAAAAEDEAIFVAVVEAEGGPEVGGVLEEGA